MELCYIAINVILRNVVMIFEMCLALLKIKIRKKLTVDQEVHNKVFIL